LNFAVGNPRHSDEITFRHLFTHTSSIADGNYGSNFLVSGDSPLSLREFLEGYLSPGGRWFTADGSYIGFRPGERFSYSNVGIALAGYLGERLTGRSLKAETARDIFAPLGMSPAAWSLGDLGQAPQATPYEMSGENLVPISPIGYPDWPAGLLRTSATSLTRFIAAHAGGGRLEATRILLKSTVDKMASLQTLTDVNNSARQQGLFWEGMRGEGPRLISKGGGDPGAHSLVGFSPDTGNGAVVLTNRGPSEKLQKAMEALIRQAAA
jgi:CubicO group peptidase (beta-lactamase class C family)